MPAQTAHTREMIVIKAGVPQRFSQNVRQDVQRAPPPPLIATRSLRI